jgi:hypothetical protein
MKIYDPSINSPLDNPGSVTVNWSSSSFGSNLFGIGGILVTLDPPPQAGNIFGTDRSGSGSFTKELTAGTHTIIFLDLSNMGGGTGQPGSVDAHLHETLMFSITGTVEPPSPISRACRCVLAGPVGLMFFLAVWVRGTRLWLGDSTDGPAIDLKD